MARWLILLVIVGFIFYLARAVLSPFVVAAFLAYIFSPLIDEIERRTRFSRIAVVSGFFVIVLGLLGFGIWLLESRLVQEFRVLSTEGPNLIDVALVRLLGPEAFHFLGQPVNPHQLAVWLNDSINDFLGNPSDALGVAERAVDATLKTFLTLLALFYFLLDGRRVGPYILRFVAPQHRAHVEAVAQQVHLMLGRYLRGQLYLIALMSFVTYLVLSLIFHLPFALPIAIATGVLEVIPLLGPILAGAVASVVALVHGGPALMLWIIATYFVLRQAEDQLVMPLVVGRAVHLHPVVTIFAVLTASAIAGVIGAVLAVPVAAAFKVALDYIFPSVEPAAHAPDSAAPAQSPVSGGAPAAASDPLAR